MSFNPWMEPPMPAPFAYQQPAPRPAQPRPPVAAPRPPVRPPEPSFRPVYVPPPGQLGIALADPPVGVPSPDTLGITLD